MKSPSQLIEDRVSEMDDMGMYGGNDFGEDEYYYTCMDTGMRFETYGEAAMYSPYTGSSNIVMSEEVVEQPSDYMKSTDIPPSQKNMQKQVPPSMNPAPSQSGPATWQTTQTSPNPAPDASSMVGATSAGPQGFVAYPQQSVPPYKTMPPNQKT